MYKIVLASVCGVGRPVTGIIEERDRIGTRFVDTLDKVGCHLAPEE
jgi:hypothetical protein